MPSGENLIKELAWRVADKLLKANRFVTLADTQAVLRYEDGVYTEGGEAYVMQKVQENAEEAAKPEISTHLVNEVLGHIRRTTLKPRTIFEETNPHLVLSNCLLDLETFQQEPFSPDYYALNKMPVTYDPSIDYRSSLFWTFINEILSSDDVQGVQEELGAILRKKYLTKKFSIWQGDTDTGKTTLVSVLLGLLGPDNVSSVPIQQLGSRDRFSIAQLYGKMANIRDDLSKDVIYSVGKLKELTGGFQVQGEKKFQNPFNFMNHAYMIYTCNVLPPVEEDDSAFFNRVMLRKFARPFGGKDKPDRELIDRLTTPEELSAALNWGLEGLKKLKANGWNFSNTISTDATREEYKRQSDPVWAYANARLVEESESLVFKEALYNDFKVYCSNPFVNIPLISRDQFFKQLPEKVTVLSGYRADPNDGGKKKHCFVGIRLVLIEKKSAPPAPPAPRQEKLAREEQPEQPEQGSPYLSRASAEGTREAEADGVCELCGQAGLIAKMADGVFACEVPAGSEPAMTSERRTTGKVIFQIECPVCGKEGLLHLQQQFRRNGSLSTDQLSVWHGAQGWPRRGGVHYLPKRDFPEVYEEFLPLPGPGQVIEEGEEEATPAGGQEVDEDAGDIRAEEGRRGPGGRESEGGGP